MHQYAWTQLLGHAHYFIYGVPKDKETGAVKVNCARKSVYSCWAMYLNWVNCVPILIVMYRINGGHRKSTDMMWSIVPAMRWPWHRWTLQEQFRMCHASYYNYGHTSAWRTGSIQTTYFVRWRKPVRLVAVCECLDVPCMLCHEFCISGYVSHVWTLLTDYVVLFLIPNYFKL